MFYRIVCKNLNQKCFTLLSNLVILLMTNDNFYYVFPYTIIKELVFTIIRDILILSWFFTSPRCNLFKIFRTLNKSFKFQKNGEVKQKKGLNYFGTAEINKTQNYFTITEIANYFKNSNAKVELIKLQIKSKSSFFFYYIFILLIFFFIKILS